jgi:hypothetical protein
MHSFNQYLMVTAYLPGAEAFSPSTGMIGLFSRAPKIRIRPRME